MTKFFYALLLVFISVTLFACAPRKIDADAVAVDIIVECEKETRYCRGFLYDDKIITTAHIFDGIDLAQSICTVNNMTIPSIHASILFIDDDIDVALLSSPTYVKTTVVPTVKLNDAVTVSGGTKCRITGVTECDGKGKPLKLIKIDAFLPKGTSGAPVFNDKGDVIGIIAARDKNGKNSYAISGIDIIAVIKAYKTSLTTINVD